MQRRDYAERRQYSTVFYTPELYPLISQTTQYSSSPLSARFAIVDRQRSFGAEAHSAPCQINSVPIALCNPYMPCPPHQHVALLPTMQCMTTH
jgi:hypothetical protein